MAKDLIIILTQLIIWVPVEPLCYKSETNIRLYINDTSVKKRKKIIKKISMNFQEILVNEKS